MLRGEHSELRKNCVALSVENGKRKTMAGNTIGQIFRLTSFGESHGEALGGVIDGCPAGLAMDFDAIQTALNKRRPGQSALTTSRNEKDMVRFVSGIFEGRTTGTPIAFWVLNKDAKSKDYSNVKDTFRPSHADYTYTQKYGLRDYRGGGRSSARETLVRVVAGEIAKQVLAHKNISFSTAVSAVANVAMDNDYTHWQWAEVEKNPVRFPDAEKAKVIEAKIAEAKAAGDSLGGIVSCVVRGVPPGLGEPVFDKLHADLGKAMLSINAVKGFEIGSGFESTRMQGSQHNDAFAMQGEHVRTLSNHSGGIQGGISNGEDIYFRVAFKPVSTLRQTQQTVNTQGENTTLKVEGRHDPCVLPRAVPIVEAMAAIVIVDHYLRNQSVKMDRLW